MANVDKFFNEIQCSDREICTSSNFHCKTCIRNKVNTYSDKFSIKKNGYESKYWSLENK